MVERIFKICPSGLFQIVQVMSKCHAELTFTSRSFYIQITCFYTNDNTTELELWSSMNPNVYVYATAAKLNVFFTNF